MAFIQMNLLSQNLMRTVPVNVILPVDKQQMPGMPQRGETIQNALPAPRNLRKLYGLGDRD